MMTNSRQWLLVRRKGHVQQFCGCYSTTTSLKHRFHIRSDLSTAESILVPVGS